MGSKRKILMISHHYYPHVGGVEKHLYFLTKHLKDKGYQVKILTSNSGDKSEKDIVEVIRLKLLKIRYFGLLWIWFLMMINLKKILWADVIHCHDVFIWYLPFRFIFFWKPVYITFHGYENHPLQKKHILIRRLSEFLSNGSIIVGDFINKWYGIRSKYVIYGASELKMSDNKTLEKPYDMVFVGRLDTQTDVQIYLKALKLCKKIRDLKVVFVGDGNLRKIVEESGYKVTGFVNDVDYYYRNTKIALVSRYLSIIEALSHRLPIISAYSNPIKKDYLLMSPFKDFVFVSDNSEKISKHILSLLKTENTVNERGYSWAKTQTWGRVINIYEKLWGMNKL